VWWWVVEVERRMEEGGGEVRRVEEVVERWCGGGRWRWRGGWRKEVES
jgi:hypothetical protein